MFPGKGAPSYALTPYLSFLQRLPRGAFEAMRFLTDDETCSADDRDGLVEKSDCHLESQCDSNDPDDSDDGGDGDNAPAAAWGEDRRRRALVEASASVGALVASVLNEDVVDCNADADADQDVGAGPDATTTAMSWAAAAAAESRLLRTRPLRTRL